MARKRHRGIVVINRHDVSQALEIRGFARGHFTWDHSKATLLVMMLNAWAVRGLTYGLIAVPNPIDTTYEIHEYRVRKGQFYATPYYIDIDQTLANFQRLYGETHDTHEGIPRQVSAL